MIVKVVAAGVVATTNVPSYVPEVVLASVTRSPTARLCVEATVTRGLAPVAINYIVPPTADLIVVVDPVKA